jgi:HlyD family secretion protein
MAVTQATAQQPAAASAAQQNAEQSEKGRRTLLRLLILAVLAGVALLVWRIFFSTPAIPPNIVALSGRVEGDDSAVAPKTAGRIAELRFREGDRVKANEVIAVLDDDQVKDREDQARAALAQSQARQRAAEQQLLVLDEQLRQTELETGQATVDAQGRVNQAQGDLAALEAELGQQKATLKLAVFDRDAYTSLAKSGAVAERQARQAIATAEAQEALVAASERRVEAARGALNMAKANLSNPPIRRSQSAAVSRQIAEERAEIANAAADLQHAQAQLAEAQANRRDLVVRAPFDGTIATRAAEPGEVVQAGTALVTMLDMTKVYLRGFIPEGQIGKVKLGQAARVYLDSNPTAPLEARVSRIDPEATFTPENTYFRDDRVKQVVGVKLQLTSGFGYAKPGMPADGEILVAGDTWPAGSHRK